jgi:hypothetical protein
MSTNQYSFVTVWKIEAPNRLSLLLKTTAVLNFFALIIKPLLAWNHNEMMRWGAMGLANKLNAKLVEY